MRRLSVAAVVALMSCLSLGACYLGPDPVQNAALAVVAGRPTAVVAVCGQSIVTVRLYLHDTTMDGTYPTWDVLIRLPKPVREIEVELLGAPRPGWQILTATQPTTAPSPGAFRIVPLTKIEPGRHYTLDSSKGGGERGSAAMVTFTTGDLSTIGPGQVLTAVKNKQATLVARDTFINDRCGDGS
jgi:hypothetical protein